MTPKIPTLVLTCFLVVLPIALTADAECPSKEDVSPCICEETLLWGDGNEIICDKIDNEELAKVANNLRGMTFDSFIIRHSKFGFIPHDVFKGVKFAVLTIKDSTLVALSDKNEAFVGLEDHLENLLITGCIFTNDWYWSVLRNLKKLKYLSIRNSLNLDTIGTDSMKVFISSNLKYISFTRNNISVVSDRAFDSFKNVINMNLSNNKIKNVKRTMLPNPASELAWFDISGNLIEQLPEDMFVNMPNLKRLYIDKNQIVVLNEKTFSPVWEQLQIFNTSGNALRCDCRMSWLLEKRTPNDVDGECASPPELQGKKLIKLDSKDFVCYV